MSYSPLELAVAFIQAGELDDALAALNQHLDKNPADDRVRRIRINVLRHLNDPQAALADFAHLSDHTADDALQRSTLLEQANDLKGAGDSLAAACERWPGHERIAERYVQVLINAGQLEAALDVVRQQPRAWRWWQWEGDLLAQMGDDTTATARYGLALAGLEDHLTPYLAPLKARLLLARAHAYRRLGHIDLAEEHYRAAEAIIPDDPLIPFLRGLLCLLRGDYDDALNLCRPVFDSVSDSLREQMLTELRGDTRYTGLLTALQENA